VLFNPTSLQVLHLLVHNVPPKDALLLLVEGWPRVPYIEHSASRHSQLQPLWSGLCSLSSKWCWMGGSGIDRTSDTLLGVALHSEATTGPAGQELYNWIEAHARSWRLIHLFECLVWILLRRVARTCNKWFKTFLCFLVMHTENDMQFNNIMGMFRSILYYFFKQFTHILII
jgi:hypothetical protein